MDILVLTETGAYVAVSDSSQASDVDSIRGTDDVYFDVKWSHWLSETIPGTKRRVEFEGVRIFFPEERPEDFNKELRDFWK